MSEITLLDGITVSRETENRLRHYGQLIAEWNPKINLVSPTTLPYLWERHILDSVQITNYLREGDKLIADIGSGGGLPVIPMAIICDKKTFIAVESDQRKVAFLTHVKALIGLDNLTFRNQRVEEIQGVDADVITARACATINKLIAYSVGLRHKDSRCLFLKGRQHQSEIDEAKTAWEFDSTLLPSATEEGACIVELTNLKKK
jgi:16S rRNA (guanine527-N7)-methyltransferase